MRTTFFAPPSGAVAARSRGDYAAAARIYARCGWLGNAARAWTLAGRPADAERCEAALRVKCSSARPTFWWGTDAEVGSHAAYTWQRNGQPLKAALAFLSIGWGSDADLLWPPGYRPGRARSYERVEVWPSGAPCYEKVMR